MAQIQYQFDRIYELVIGDKGTSEGVLITNLQMEFDIEKSADHSEKPTTSTIKITNVSDETLKVLQKDYPVCQLSVGYRDTGLKQILIGNVVELETKKDNGPDRITTLKVMPAYSSINYTYITATVGKNRTVKDVFETIRAKLPDVAKGVYAGNRVNSILPYGYSISNTPRQVFDALARAYNIEYRIDKGILYVNDLESVLEKNIDSAYLFSDTTGVLYGPYYTTGRMKRSKKDPFRETGLQLKALLNPDINPGSVIKVVGNGIDGFYKAYQIKYSGSYRGAEWVMEIEAVTFAEAAARNAHRAEQEAKKKRTQNTVTPNPTPLPVRQ